MMQRRRRLRALFLLLPALLVGGSDCVPQLGIAEAADCCACLAKTDDDGAQASAADNCLPDDLSQGFSQQVERDQCAADAADAISGAGDVVVVAACLAEAHPCGDICTRAAAAGVDFATD